MSILDTLNDHARVAHAYRDEDGWWADLKPGWVCIHSSAHTCHEDTANALMTAVNDAERCTCGDCAEHEVKP